VCATGVERLNRRPVSRIVLAIALIISTAASSLSAKALGSAAGKPHLYTGPAMLAAVFVSWTIAAALLCLAIANLARTRPLSEGLVLTIASVIAAVAGPIVAGALYLMNCFFKC
jgi:hypothetical protein